MPGNWNSGRRPQPTALKILRGNPSKKRLPEGEPAPAALDDTWITPPTEITGDARAESEWTRLVPLLRDCGLITQAERGALISLCQQWSSYLEARACLKRDGLTTEQGRASPFIDIADRALGHCHRLWHELGLTPSGRAKVGRVPAARTAPASKWAGLL